MEKMNLTQLWLFFFSNICTAQWFRTFIHHSTNNNKQIIFFVDKVSKNPFASECYEERVAVLLQIVWFCRLSS